MAASASGDLHGLGRIFFLEAHSALCGRRQAATKGRAPALLLLAAGLDARRVSAVHGCWVLAVEIVGQGMQRSDTHPRAGVEGTPLGGGRATTRRWAKGAKRLAHNGWAGANTTDCAQAPDQNTLRFRRSRYRAGQMTASARRALHRVSAGRARRARGARHNGGLLNPKGARPAAAAVAAPNGALAQ